MVPKENKIPFHFRFGLRLLQVLIIIVALLLVKRCVNLYYDNKFTDQRTKIEYFDKGFANGMNKARGMPETPEPQFKNYTFKKAYRDGFRRGWDKGRESVRSQ